MDLKSILKFFIILFTNFKNVDCNPSFEPIWESLYPETFEIGKESIGKEHISKFRLKSSELYLPLNVIPKSYKLKIRPILNRDEVNPNEQFTAPGSVEIVVFCVTATDSIYLHADTKEFITIFEDKIKVEFASNLTNQRSVSVRGHSYDEEDTDFYQILLSSPLKAGMEYIIYIDFVTKIATDSLNGLYLSKYKTPSGEIKLLAVTQFEDISARKMFPCFDQPDMKSIFEITISRSEIHNSMSNMPIIFSEPDPEKDGYFLDHFAPTPLMSSYLVAIVVSEFTCTTAPSYLYSKTVQACGPKHMIDIGGGVHAAQISARILQFYDDLWLQPYPLPKMQSVAIPNFAAGAMENYGLNTYRLVYLLYHAGVTKESSRHSIESTIAHELAHQNYGDLVTCKTWNQIFLNEGFATYVSYYGVQEVSPEFNSDVGWYTGYFQKALRTDANPDVHSLVKINDYFGDFDAITYSKGASLIKMMENILTKDTLFHGLRTYLKLYAYGNTVYHDLFDTLNAQARLNKTHPHLADMTEIMEGWTLNPGFPLIRVQWIFQNMFYVQQERFQSQSSSKTNNTDNKSSPILWYCPIFIVTSQDSDTESNDRPKFWLTNKEVTKAWVTKVPVDWIIVNANSAAYFRVLYDESLTAAIQNQLDTKSTVFSPITRAQLIDDAFECGWAKYTSIETALNRTKFLKTEVDANVWSTALYHFTKIYPMVSDDPVTFSAFKNYLDPRIHGVLTLIGVEQLPEDKGKIVMQRGSLLAWGAIIQVQVVLEYADKLIENWKMSPDLNPIPIDIRGEIYCSSVAAGNTNTFDFIFKQYLLEKDQDQKRMLLKGLGCSRDAIILQSLLESITKQNSGITKEDGYILLQKLAGNSVSRISIYSYIKENFNDLLNYFGTKKIFSDVMSMLSFYWNTEEKLSLVNEFINEHFEQLGPIMKSINSTVLKIEDNIRWMKAYGGSISTWLEKQPENNSKV